MATPQYQGQGQPIADSGGWLGRLGSFFGGGAPAYAPAPTAITNETPKVDAKPSETAEAVATCPIDPGALPPGQIVLVVPRRSGE